MTAEISATRSRPLPLRGDGAFTRYLRHLDTASGGDEAALQDVWKALRDALAWELKRRALWSCPPSFLGIYGWRSWEGERGGRERHDALEELAVDCYSFIFLERLVSLRGHLRVKANIDGLVLLCIRQFLHNRQLRHDRLGFRVFEATRLAVREGVATGEIFVIQGDGKIVNQTILGSRPEADPLELALPGSIAGHVASWNNELLPDLVTASGPARRKLVASLRRCFAALLEREAPVVRFKDVVAPLKSDVRRRWASILEYEGGESVSERAGTPSSGSRRAKRPEADWRLAERDFRRLEACVSELLGKLEAPKRTQHYLDTLWGYLRAAIGVRTPGVAESSSDERIDWERLPSNRRLAEQLRIPRARLPDLFATLGDLVLDCQARLSGAGVKGPARRPSHRRREP